MSVRDMYITMLEKRASEHDVLGVDNQAIANDEHGANLQDQRSELTGMFNQAGAVAKADTKLMNKSLPIAKKTDGTAASSTMLKSAMNSAFFQALRDTGHMKVASPEYLRAAYGGFNDELEKIALAPLAIAGLSMIPDALKGAKKLFKGATGDEAEKTARMRPADVKAILAKMPKRKPKLTIKPTGLKSTFQVSKMAGDPNQTDFRAVAR
jgi:hypothetical protein